jgi:isoleucyl-tRNA synthetase
LDVTDLLAVAMANRPIELQIKKSHLSGAAPRREREKTKFISYCDNILQEIIEAVTLAVVRLGLFRDNRKREREGVFFFRP